MNIDPTSIAATGAARDIGTGKTDLGKEDFLKLLTVQLAQQDPLNPQDGTEFVTQLAQFSSLERLLNIEAGLGNVALAATATNSTLAADFIGKTVRVSGDGLTFDGDAPASMTFSLEGDAAEVQVKVEDSQGNVVRTIQTTGQEGDNTALWDGKTDDGKLAPAGQYTFSVARAVDGDGQKVTASTQAVSRVTSVSFKNGYPELLLANGMRVSMSQVIEVLDAQPSATPSAAPTADAPAIDPLSPGAAPTNSAAPESTTGSQGPTEDLGVF